MSDRPWLDRPCPKCGAESGKSCRALTSGRSTDTHEARWYQNQLTPTATEETA